MPDDHKLPQSVEKAVDCLLADLSLNAEVQITMMKNEDLHSLHFSLGTYATASISIL